MFGLPSRRSNGVRVSASVHRSINDADDARDRGDWDAAIASYSRAVAMAPRLGHIWTQLGNCAGEAGRYDQALDAYSRAHTSSPASIDPLLFSARISERIGDLDATRRYYMEVLSIDPNHAEASDAARRLSTVRTLPVFDVKTDPKRTPHCPPGVSIAEMQVRLDSHHFHHGIDFGSGLASKADASVDFVNQTAEALLGGVDLRGRSVLDIGTWSGAYAFEAKWRGAARVVATDHYTWNNSEFRGREAFDLAHAITGLEIEAYDIDVPDLSQSSVGSFDVVLFAGVFYHLFDPINLTRQISSCAKHLLIVETHLNEINNPEPAMRFYPGATLNNDGSNWWGPNASCMYELLREIGFSDIWYCDAPAITQRGIFHAFRNEQSRNLLRWTTSGPWKSLSDEATRRAMFYG